MNFTCMLHSRNAVGGEGKSIEICPNCISNITYTKHWRQKQHRATYKLQIYEFLRHSSSLVHFLLHCIQQNWAQRHASHRCYLRHIRHSAICFKKSLVNHFSTHNNFRRPTCISYPHFLPKRIEHGRASVELGQSPMGRLESNFRTLKKNGLFQHEKWNCVSISYRVATVTGKTWLMNQANTCYKTTIERSHLKKPKK